LCYHEGMNKLSYTVIVLAAGKGRRMELDINKVLLRLADGRRVIDHSLSLFEADPDCKQILLVIDPAQQNEYKDLDLKTDFDLVYGGSQRQQSVYQGLLAVKEDVVLIHDGARPFLDLDCLNRLKDALLKHPACILGVPANDTIKVIQGNTVLQTLNRAQLIQAQTPQGFQTELIKSCYQEANASKVLLTDDAQAVELYGNTDITVVNGSYDNIKITTKRDLKGYV